MPKIVKQHPNPKTTPSKTQTSKSNDEFQSGWDFSESMSCIFYGAPGTGKTTLWATFPGPILALLCSGGRKPGELRSINTPEYRKKITPRVLTSMDMCKRAMEDAHKFQTVVVDHATGLLDLALKDVMNVEEIPEQKSWGFTDQQTWGQAIGMSKDVCREILSFSSHNVFIGQQRTTQPKEDEDSELFTSSVGIDVSPSLAGWLNYSCDYICQTFRRQKMIKVKVAAGKNSPEKMVEKKAVKNGRPVMEYGVRIAPHEVFTTKFRVSKDISLSLPDVILDPTYEKLLAAIQGENKV